MSTDISDEIKMKNFKILDNMGEIFHDIALAYNKVFCNSLL